MHVHFSTDVDLINAPGDGAAHIFIADTCATVQYQRGFGHFADIRQALMLNFRFAGIQAVYRTDGHRQHIHPGFINETFGVFGGGKANIFHGDRFAIF
ncbi:hypothetical protein D3C81_1994770 [compost metagenome]